MDHNKKYAEITERLGIDQGKDRDAGRVLEGLLPKGHSKQKDVETLGRAIRHKNVFVFGAGPSLRKDIEEIGKHRIDRSPNVTFIAADGAAKALSDQGLLPHVQVTDLDGFPEKTIELNKRGVITVVHAHADNVETMKSIVPKMANVIPTTQTEPSEHLHNFGGFTDGDRCVFLADHFNPLLIVLAGMDFGKEVGGYSGRYDAERKAVKLAIGKKLIEGYAREAKATIVNITSKGEDIWNVPRVKPEELKNFFY